VRWPPSSRGWRPGRVTYPRTRHGPPGRPERGGGSRDGGRGPSATGLLRARSLISEPAWGAS
jgi:hypothetical protein